MRYQRKKLKSLKISQKKRGQVFILATLIIVVYTVSMIAVVTEVSINRTKTDTVNLTHMVDEYLSEMNYQLELGLYNYVLFPSVTADTVISNLQSFVTAFSQYASNKGIATTINLRLNEFVINATKNNAASATVTTTPYTNTMYMSLNSSIVFQSSNGGSSISGVFIHYYGINAYISSLTPTLLTLTQKDFYGNTLSYITGANFTTPGGVVDNHNGDYTGIFVGSSYNTTLPSGLEFII